MSSDEQRSFDSQFSDLAGYIDTGQRYAAARETGEIGEAVTGAYISELADGNIVSQHNPGDAPQGIDTTFLDSSGELHAAESKAIGQGDWHQPQTSRTVDGRQMDQAWTADRLSGIGLDADAQDVGEEAGQVHRDLFQIDVPGDAFARYSVNDDGTRADRSPDEMWSLSDIVGVADADTADSDAMDAEWADHGETG